MYARMCGCMRALVACIPACVRALVHECCECARERPERRRNPSARPPNVGHFAHIYVGTSTCERMYMHMYVRACRSHASVCVCARVFARAAGAAMQPEVATSSYVSLCTYI